MWGWPRLSRLNNLLPFREPARAHVREISVFVPPPPDRRILVAPCEPRYLEPQHTSQPSSFPRTALNVQVCLFSTQSPQRALWRRRGGQTIWQMAVYVEIQVEISRRRGAIGRTLTYRFPIGYANFRCLPSLSYISPHVRIAGPMLFLEPRRRQTTPEEIPPHACGPEDTSGVGAVCLAVSFDGGRRKEPVSLVVRTITSSIRTVSRTCFKSFSFLPLLGILVLRPRFLVT